MKGNDGECDDGVFVANTLRTKEAQQPRFE